MEGRRFSEGLHQAIEAKEGLRVRNENVTLATITVQNYFRMYQKLSGMTGTAKTEEQEFLEIYGMSVVQVPTHRTMIRQDEDDMIFTTEAGKYRAIVDEIVRIHKTGAPVLVGTISIERSELLSSLLKQKGIVHQVLNAKHHAKEAEIIARAGQKNCVTIATNMAGRGTDILLGEGVVDAGGLHIIGTERHESRRIDNQLRGRAGRQGDPGRSQFFISFQDEMIRRFGGDRVGVLLERLKYDENMPISSGFATKTIERAQRQVEASNFDQRKSVLRFDNVINQQRDIIYKQRREVIERDDLDDVLSAMITRVGETIVSSFCSESTIEEDWDLASLTQSLNELFGKKTIFETSDFKGKGLDEVLSFVEEKLQSLYHTKRASFGPNALEVEKMVMLRVVDSHWMEHIDAMDHLRDGIYLRSYGQKDPFQEYQFEGFEMFQSMIDSIDHETVMNLMCAELVEETQRKEVAKEITTSGGGEEGVKKPVVRDEKVGRNEPCPCGSGKKYKNCHGK
jgi:preprotein translocase subunit SecA